jgi:recombination protein RecA
VLDLAAANNIVEKSGSWYAFNGERIGQGRDNARVFLKENPDKLARIDQELRKTLGLLSTSPVSEAPAVAESAAAGGGRK